MVGGYIGEIMNVIDILEKLVFFDSVVGMMNVVIVEWIVVYFDRYGVVVKVLFGLEGDWSNLFVMIGLVDVLGYIVFGYMDVVLVDVSEWIFLFFIFCCDGDRLFGCGMIDMKGYFVLVFVVVL